MFIRKATFDYLVRRSETQQQQIDKLSEMIGIIAKSVGQQLELDFGEDWKIQSTADNHIVAGCQEGSSSDWSF